MEYYKLTFEGLFKLLNKDIDSENVIYFKASYRVNKNEKTKIISNNKKDPFEYYFIERVILTEKELKSLKVIDFLEKYIDVRFIHEKEFSSEDQKYLSDSNLKINIGKKYIIFYKFYSKYKNNNDIFHHDSAFKISDNEFEERMDRNLTDKEISECFQKVTEKEYKNNLIKNRFN